MKWSSIAGCSWRGLFADSAPVQAQRSILSKDNVAFGRELYTAGFAELADRCARRSNEAEAKKIEVDPTELVAVKVLKLDLRLDAARREPDLTLRLEQMKAVLKEKLAFINEFTRTSTAQDARNELPETYRVLGETYTTALQEDAGSRGRRVAAHRRPRDLRAGRERAERAHRVLQGPGQERRTRAIPTPPSGS